MEIYDELTGTLLTDPDLSAGYLYSGQRVTVHHEAVPPVTEIGILPGTEHCNGGAGLRGSIVVTPGTPAWDEYEDCQYYHKYTDDELAAQQGDEHPDEDDDITSRVKILEDGQNELTEALNMILTGATE